MQNPWLEKHATLKSIPSIKVRTSLRNIQDFRTQMVFQKAVLSYIASQELTRTEETELKSIFATISMKKKARLKSSHRLTVDKRETEMEKRKAAMSNAIDYNEFLMANLNKEGILTRDRLEKTFKYFDYVSARFDV